MKPRKSKARLGLSAAAVVGALSAAPGNAFAQGMLGDINGQPTGGVTFAQGTWQQYSYSFTATQASSALSFTFRNDPAYSALDDVSLVAQGSSANLVTNGGLETPGSTVNGVTAPAG